MREGMRSELRRLIERLHITTLYVTHDQIEALSMAHRIAVMAQGKIAQEAAPKEIYMAPMTRFVASFVGKVNFLEAHAAGRLPAANGWLLRAKVGVIAYMGPADLRDGERVIAAIRPEAILVRRSDTATGSCCDNTLSGRIASSTFYGEHIEYQVDVGGEMLNARSDGYAELDPGDAVSVNLPANRIVVFSADAGEGSREGGE
jgi:ABC-type Fe3+/spermidine/putrescine transport system ATPase subunit